MSGGRFEHKQYEIARIADEIQNAIDNNDVNEQYPETIIDSFKYAVALLRKAHVYVHRIDYLLSNDDGVDNFVRRLNSDVNNLRK